MQCGKRCINGKCKCSRPLRTPFQTQALASFTGLRETVLILTLSYLIPVSSCSLQLLKKSIPINHLKSLNTILPQPCLGKGSPHPSAYSTYLLPDYLFKKYPKIYTKNQNLNMKKFKNLTLHIKRYLTLYSRIKSGLLTVFFKKK